MTDLEKRVEKYIDDNEPVIISRKDMVDFITNFAKSETALLSQHILDLQKDKGNLTDKVKDLEQENTKLKCECRRCVYTDSPCVLSDYGKDRSGICDHFKDMFDENTELRTKLEASEGQIPWKDIKDKSELIGKLTNAKDILRRLMENQPTPSSMYEEIDLAGWREVNKEAEKFLKEE